MICLPNKDTFVASPEMYSFVIPATAYHHGFSGSAKPESGIFCQLKNIRTPVFHRGDDFYKTNKIESSKTYEKSPGFSPGLLILPEFSQPIIAIELHHPGWLNDAFPQFPFN